jgi:hypothetical protein
MPQTRSPLISVAASASRLGIGSRCWKAKADAHAGPFVRHRYLAHPRLQALCLGPRRGTGAFRCQGPGR